MHRFYCCDEVPGWGSCLFWLYSGIFLFTWLHCTSVSRHGGCYFHNL